MVGTSFAAPTAAGWHAHLMLAVDPYLSVDELISGLMGNGPPHLSVQDAADLDMPVWPACEAGRNVARCYCSASTCGAGRLDAEGAIQYALSELAAHPAGTGGVAGPSRQDYFAPSRSGQSPVPVRAPGSGGGAMDSGSLAALALLMWLTLTAGGRR